MITQITFMFSTVSQKDASQRTEFQLATIVGTKIGKTQTTK